MRAPLLGTGTPLYESGITTSVWKENYKRWGGCGGAPGTIVFMRVALRLLLVFLLVSFPLAAQEAQQPPSAPEPQAAPAPQHRFWDRTNVLFFSGVVVV